MGDFYRKGTTAIITLLLASIFIFCSCSSLLSSGNGFSTTDPIITTPAAPDVAFPEVGSSVTLTISALDPLGGTLVYLWSDGGAGGTFSGSGETVTWTIATVGNYTITVTVSNSEGTDVTSSFAIEVVEVGAVVHRTDAQAGYVGKATCLGCHSGIDEEAFNSHRHNHKLNPGTSEFIGAWWTGSHVFDTINMDFGSDGESYVATIDGVDHEIVRTLGWGFEKWKQRYIVKIGNSWYITPAQHNMVTDEWVNYHTGDWADGMPTGTANSYDRRCAGCHNTGTNVEFFEDTGEWVMGVSEENIQCEACHGPGEKHAGSVNPADIINPATDIADYDRRLEVCGNCHGRGNSVMELGSSTMGYPFNAAGENFRPGDNLNDFYVQNPGLWPDGHSKKHHQQYNDFLLSEHYNTGTITCETCHNVHEPDAPYTNETCTSCHGSIGADLSAHTMHPTDKQCIDCHMPLTAKSAIAYDIRSHAFDIISPQVSLDNYYADPENVMPNSCMNGGCHGGNDALADEAAIQDRLNKFYNLFGGAPTWTLTSLDVTNTAPALDVEITATAVVDNPDSAVLTYDWTDGGGDTFTGSGAAVTWSSGIEGIHTLSVLVSDGTASAKITQDVNVGGSPVFTTDPQAGYVGKSTCMGCHSGDIDLETFNSHRHNHKLNPATSEFIGAWWTGSHVFDTIDMDFGIEGETYVATIDGVDHEVIRTLGWGFEKWKQRYIVKIGNSWYITPAQHNVIDDEWVNYHTTDWDAGMPTSPANSYDRRCAGCHNTGTNVEFSADTGEWVMGVNEENVQCEACHGPGETHAGSMNKDDIINPGSDISDYDRKLEVCGNCHGRGNSVAELGGSTMGYPFSADGKNFRPGDNLDDFYVQNPGLWPDGHSKQHHQQFLDFKLSAHYAGGFVSCTTCHNVHEPDAEYTNELCATCHSSQAGDLNAHTQHPTEKLCIDCHMPFLAKSAFAYDIRSHAFDIISPQVSQDNYIADPENVMPNSCMNGGCHGGPDELTNESMLQYRIDKFNEMWP